MRFVQKFRYDSSKCSEATVGTPERSSGEELQMKVREQSQNELLEECQKELQEESQKEIIRKISELTIQKTSEVSPGEFFELFEGIQKNVLIEKIKKKSAEIKK